MTSRVTIGENKHKIDRVIDFWKNNKYVFKCIIAQEGFENKPEKEHLHIYAEVNQGMDNTCKKFRDYMWKMYPGMKKRREITCKSATKGHGTIEGAENYTCKGYSGKYIENENKIVYYKGYTNDDLIEIHGRYWKIRKEIDEKKKRRKPGGLINKIIEERNIVNGSTEETIGVEILLYYDSHCIIIPGKYKLLDMIETIKIRLKPKEEKLKYIERLVDRALAHA